MKIWLVCAECGAYSDRTDWRVDAWPDEAAAQQRVQALETEYRQVMAAHADDDWIDQEALIAELTAAMQDPGLAANVSYLYPGDERLRWGVEEIRLQSGDCELPSNERLEIK